jgi:Subtilisin inhibitor-like
MEPAQLSARPMVVKTLMRRARPSRVALTHPLRPLAAPAPGSRRPGRTLLATSIAGLIAVTGTLAGCGTQLGPNANPGSGGKHTIVRLSPPAKVAVTVSILNKKGGGGPSHWTLRCQPAGGTAPDPAAACKALMGVRKALTRLTKKPIMCPMIMVSAEQIVLKGKLFGQPINRVIADGGCDVGIFNSLKNTFY